VKQGFERNVKAVLKRLKPGDIATYGEVAEEAGFPKAARAVGNLLSNNSEGLPWWRVVRADGSLAARNRTEQARKLRSEGVTIVSNRVTGVRV
jgi:methylated-DNA-protein-cysteine methyltransferase related protein